MKTYYIVFNSNTYPLFSMKVRADGYENYYQTYRFFVYGKDENDRITIFSAPLANVLYVDKLLEEEK